MIPLLALFTGCIFIRGTASGLYKRLLPRMQALNRGKQPACSMVHRPLRRYFAYFVNQMPSFRLRELVSIAQLLGGIDEEQLRLTPVEGTSAPDGGPPLLMYMDLPNASVATQIAERCTLLYGIFELWGQGACIEECEASSDRFLSRCLRECQALLQQSWSVRVTSCGRRFSEAHTRERIRQLWRVFSKFEGPVNLVKPTIPMYLIEQYDKPIGDNQVQLQRLLLGQLLGRGCNGVPQSAYNLSSRRYIGTTTMDPFLAFLTANQAQACQGSLVLDPFCGTGGLLLPCSHFGAQVIGADADGSVLHGSSVARSIAANYQQYKLTQPVDLIHCDIAHLNKRLPVGMLFDAIVCDPPYGYREAISSNHLQVDHQAVAPATSLVECLKQLFELALQRVKLGGNLVFWIPKNRKLFDGIIPSHPGLVLSSMSEIEGQTLTRALVTMVRS